MASLAQLARSKSLRDIYGYIDNVGNSVSAITPNEHAGDEAGWGTSGAGVSVAPNWGRAEGDSASPRLLFQPDAAFADAVQLASNSANGEGSGGFRFLVDGGKLPQTRFGDVTRTAPVDGSQRLINPNLVYDDPNYGRITDARNVDTRSISDLAGPLFISLATMGMGALGAPAIATQLVNLARTLGNGGDGLSQILAMIAGQAGVPSEITTLGQLALNAGRRP